MGFGLLLAMLGSSCEQGTESYAEIKTEFGTMKVMLYESTPKHRDNFTELVQEGYYDSLLFHRVIPGFVVQGGDPDSKYARPGQQLGFGGPNEKIEPEIGAPHLRGALAMAQDGNPQRLSSGSQFYIVQGRPVDDAMLNAIEQQRNLKYNDAQRQLYKEIGGTPGLDGQYTVFGEIVDGLEVLDKISQQQTDPNNRPVEDIRMTIRMLN